MNFWLIEYFFNHLSGESLVIEGENLRLASTESEVNVTIGTKSCNLTSLAATQLVCLPPELQPAGTDEIGRRTSSSLPMVVVSVDRNNSFKTFNNLLFYFYFQI
jgi:plexin A